MPSNEKVHLVARVSYKDGLVDDIAIYACASEKVAKEAADWLGNRGQDKSVIVWRQYDTPIFTSWESLAMGHARNVRERAIDKLMAALDCMTDEEMEYLGIRKESR